MPYPSHSAAHFGELVDRTCDLIVSRSFTRLEHACLGGLCECFPNTLACTWEREREGGWKFRNTTNGTPEANVLCDVGGMSAIVRLSSQTAFLRITANM